MKKIEQEQKFWINELKLHKHTEGGYYKEIYRSFHFFPEECLPQKYSGRRNCSTSIYYLLPGNEVSHFHRLLSDEIWFFYTGSSLAIYIIDQKGILTKVYLGNNIQNKEVFQVVIPANCWFGAEVNDKKNFSLVSCVVAPGFDFKDFELAKRDDMKKKYPQHADIINKLAK